MEGCTDAETPVTDSPIPPPAVDAAAGDPWSEAHDTRIAGAESAATDEATGPTPSRTDGGSRRRLSKTAIEWTIVVAAALVIAIVIKSFLFQAFYIPSESMVPTLKIGDRVLVNKLSYDLHDVHRGDIVVFESGPNKDWQQANVKDLVKRVIGLPGETVTVCAGRHVCINDHRLKEPYLPAGTVTSFDVIPIPDCAPDSPPKGCRVPAGHFFVLGDNRSRSADSHIHGPITEGSIVGRVFVRIWPIGRIGFL
jgi:signal peptidase I